MKIIHLHMRDKVVTKIIYFRCKQDPFIRSKTQNFPLFKKSCLTDSSDFYFPQFVNDEEMYMV